MVLLDLTWQTSNNLIRYPLSLIWLKPMQPNKPLLTNETQFNTPLKKQHNTKLQMPKGKTRRWMTTMWPTLLSLLSMALPKSQRKSRSHSLKKSKSKVKLFRPMKLLTRIDALKKKTTPQVNLMTKRKRIEKVTEKEIKKRKSMGKVLREKSDRKRYLTSMVTRLNLSTTAICISPVSQNALQKMH